ncbi:hypothetical protein TCAL_02478 [Tigriopus californicus]|uniref:Uncharacterized protein n=1 Tax=Tigriopus californicus TaxID=6832 RepID=A0A553NT91_TIGCA|nr:sodium-dependent phosphate transport protein 2A-like [Tigriopus californicus]TRY68652.1 hypothetical protein TCAL_02478 [Tigriopus californicus]|eukprot:TCALIF_02478-PA protein Name:"Similar to SLC34A1 Sodium-dependent phosphate transport protein 2A (Oryctolagus cuniculus)" AED:0.03 eAED:0.03 QI:434/1/1/1/1/1/7/435/635
MVNSNVTVIQAVKRHLGLAPNPVNNNNILSSQEPVIDRLEEIMEMPPPPQSMDSSMETTPAMSTVASSADLLTMKSKKHRPINPRKIHRQISECIQDQNLQVERPNLRSRMSGLIKVPALLLLLYIFICSLDFLSSAFRLIAGKAAGSVFQDNELLNNPVVGLMIGVLFTVLVQSSSTCTSVIVSMVSSGILDVRTAIPMVMGANIGTSLTSTLVSLTQASDPQQFERAFSGATVHDCFNWLSVITLLTLEICTGYLFHLTQWITTGESNGTQSADWINRATTSKETTSKTSVNVLGAITKPLTQMIMQIDKPVLKCWGIGGCQDERLLKVWCTKPSNDSDSLDGHDGGQKCQFLMNFDGLSDGTLGVVLLIISLVLLTTCLILIVKILHSVLHGTVADLIRKFINADIPYVPWLTGYIAIFIGAILTFVVQSSSVFTSTLTPLVGVGMITVDRVYPLTLGSNIGTTTTALLASLAADPDKFQSSVQIALCHLFFNLSGILLFYPLPFMRWPLTLCKILGRTTATYRWFAVLYLLMMFFLMPGFILSVSLAGQTTFLIVMVPLMTLFFLAIIINILQVKCPTILPPIFMDWNFLPIWMHSLEPYDGVMRNLLCCSKYSPIPVPDKDQTLHTITVA